MSKIKNLTADDFDKDGNLRSLTDKQVVILFYAEFCPACRNFKPTFEQVGNKLMSNNKNIIFAKVSTPDNRDLMGKIREMDLFEVMYIPTVVSYHNGSYYSTYDYDENDPEDKKTYRTAGDLEEYAKGVGKSKINFK